MTAPRDLRLRLLSALVALLFLTPVQGFAAAFAAVCAVVALYALSRTALPWRRLLHLEGFLLLLFATLPFTEPGTALFSLGPLAASIEGLCHAVVLACKVTAGVLLLSLLFARVEPLRLAAALRGLYLPEALVRIFVTVTRHLAMMRDELSRLRDAMRMRAFRPGSNRHTWRSYGYLIGMLVVRAMERAERVEEAMRLRGYQGRFPQTVLARPASVDWVAAVVLVAGAAMLLLWDRL